MTDLTGMNAAELLALIEQATAAYQAAQRDEQQQQDQRRTDAGAAVAALQALLGPEDTAPYDPETGANETINGVLKHDTDDHAVLAQNTGLCLSLILRGMKIDVATGLNLARLAASEG